MNKLYLINGLYYVLAFDYYEAITIFEKYKNNYSEDIIQTIELVSSKVVCKEQIIKNEEKEDDENE